MSEHVGRVGGAVKQGLGRDKNLVVENLFYNAGVDIMHALFLNFSEVLSKFEIFTETFKS